MTSENFEAWKLMTRVPSSIGSCAATRTPCINHRFDYRSGSARSWVLRARWTIKNTTDREAEMTMAEELRRVSDADLLPVWQRIAWMAAIWFASVALLGLISWLVKLWLTS